VAEKKSPAGASDFVARIVKDPKQPPATIMLTGFVGASSEEGHTRLYFDANLNSYVEIPDDAILHTQAIGAEGGLGGSYVWIKQDAELTYGPAGSQRPKGKFLEGPIMQGAAAAGPPIPPATVSPAICNVTLHCAPTPVVHCAPTPVVHCAPTPVVHCPPTPHLPCPTLPAICHPTLPAQCPATPVVLCPPTPHLPCQTQQCTLPALCHVTLPGQCHATLPPQCPVASAVAACPTLGACQTIACQTIACQSIACQSIGCPQGPGTGGVGLASPHLPPSVACAPTPIVQCLPTPHAPCVSHFVQCPSVVLRYTRSSARLYRRIARPRLIVHPPRMRLAYRTTCSVHRW
jgi:hypothetical protein